MEKENINKTTKIYVIFISEKLPCIKKISLSYLDKYQIDRKSDKVFLEFFFLLTYRNFTSLTHEGTLVTVLRFKHSLYVYYFLSAESSVRPLYLGIPGNWVSVQA